MTTMRMMIYMKNNLLVQRP